MPLSRMGCIYDDNEQNNMTNTEGGLNKTKLSKHAFNIAFLIGSMC